VTTFSIRVYAPDGTPAIVPGSLDVQPQAWSGVDVGGMWDADIAVNGSLEELAGLTSWLGNRLEIINANGSAVWWGDVAAVEVTANGIRRGISLDRMANRIQVRYAQGQPGGGAVSADTAWADDATSQAAYGIWERRISPEREMTATEATSFRATALTALSEPHYMLALDGGPTQARIYCKGFWQRGARFYYAQPAGIVEHVPSGTAAPLGLGFTSSTVAFVTRTDEIHGIAGLLSNFQSGYRITTTGASNGGNNSTWLLDSGGDSRPAVTYVSTGVTWSANDDILDSNSGLGFIANDDAFTVSGASNAIHNGTQLMDKAGATAVEANNTYRGGNFTSEAAGASITFKRGNKVGVTGNLVNEQAGSSVTVTAWGQKHYQPFTLPTAGSWTAARIEIRLRKVGTPTDGVIVQLTQDSAGVPGTVLDSATVDDVDIPDEMGWVAFELSNADTLTYGTTYGITVARTGANSATNYYEIDLDADATYAAGVERQWDGATWQTPSPAADMVFRVLGAVDTGTQAGEILESWAGAVDAALSSIEAHQYRTGETRAIDEVTALLNIGTDAGLRLLARMQRNLVAQVYARPDKSTARWSYQGGALYDLFGQAAEDGFLPAGEWVQLGDASGLGPWARLSPVFVERAEYRAGGGLSIEPEGSKDVYETGVVQG
jgi:hypothetical protein